MPAKVPRILIWLICVILLAQCDTYEFPKSPYPRLETLPIMNVSEAGVTLQARINKVGEIPIINHGFVWGLQENFAVTDLAKISLGSISSIGPFEAQINYGLYADTTYYVKAFIQTDSYFVYGKTVSFTSAGSTPPTISEFHPGEGTWGDTIHVSGRYFSKLPTNNLVQFGSADAIVISATDSTLRCIVPEGIVELQVPLSVSVTGNRSISATEFKLTKPRIDHFAPSEGTFGDIVTISGSNFGARADQNRVMFNDKVAEIIEVSKTLIKVKVPVEIMSKENQISLIFNLQSAKADATFKISPPSIKNISASEGFINGTLEIQGDNFNPTPQGNILHLGGNAVRILTASRQSLTVEIPDGNFMQRMNRFELTVAEQTATSVDALTIKDAWIRKSDSPPTDWPIIAFGIDGKGYVVSGDQTWSYNPATNTWANIARYPGEKKIDPLGFVVGGMAYIGFGINTSGDAQSEFWRFNPMTTAWTRMEDSPIDGLSGGVALSAGGKGYIASGFETIGLWEYDPASDMWTWRGGELDAGIAGYPHRADAGFSIGDRMFLYLADDTEAANPLFEFDFATDTWLSRGVPEESDYTKNQSTTGFSVQGKGYIKGIKNLYVFDPATNNWQTRPSARLGELYFGKSFVIDNKAYIVGPYLGNRYSLWEYDPAYDVP